MGIDSIVSWTARLENNQSEKLWTLRILGMSWGVKPIFFEALKRGVMNGGSGVSIGGGEGFLG